MKNLVLLFIGFVACFFACVLMSAGSVENAVYTVENGVYYHQCGDCAVAEKSHDHSRKISITSKGTAESKLFLPCRKCCK